MIFTTNQTLISTTQIQKIQPDCKPNPIQIAAIENSSEFKLGLSKGAVVNKGVLYFHVSIQLQLR
jgi:hypothetical protein